MRLTRHFRKRPELLRSLMGFLIFLYLTGSLQLDSVHRLIHDHDERSAHTEELEQNACHRTVFHQATQNTCDHPTHVSEDKKCLWCFGYVHHETILQSLSQNFGFKHFEKHQTFYHQNHLSSEVASADSRGPPYMK